MIGDFADAVPNDEALDAIRSLIAIGVSEGHIKEEYTLRVHRDADNCKDCPGEKFYEELKTRPNVQE